MAASIVTWICYLSSSLIAAMAPFVLVPLLLWLHFANAYGKTKIRLLWIVLLPFCVAFMIGSAIGGCEPIMSMPGIRETPYLLRWCMLASTVTGFASIGFEFGVARSLGQRRSFAWLAFAGGLGGITMASTMLTSALFVQPAMANVFAALISVSVFVIFTFSTLRADAEIRQQPTRQS